MTKWISRIAVVALVAGVVAFLVIKRPWAKGETPITFTTVVVGKGNIAAQVTANGTLSARTTGGEESHFASSLFIAAIGTLPFIVAGVSVLAEAGGGLQWVLTGFISAIVGSMLNAWILLVEILR